MAEVHRTKVVSSIEPRPLRRNVTTEFEWEVASVKETLNQSGCISSPSFDVHGTEGSQRTSCSREEIPSWETSIAEEPKRVSLNLWHEEGQPWHLSWRGLEFYTLSVEAKISCESHAQASHVHFNGTRRSFSDIRGQHLVTIEHGSPLARAIEERDRLYVNVRITTISSRGRPVNTVLDLGTEVRPPPSLAEDMKCALKSGDLADVTLKSEDGGSFEVHRQLLALRSPVFRAMFYNGRMMESQSGMASIKASSIGLRQLLDFIYTDEIDGNAVESNASECLELGTQYELTRLVALIMERLFSTISVDNAAERLLLALRYSSEKLEKACQTIIKDNLTTVMRTEGWTLIANNPEVMGVLMSCGSERHGEDEPSPQKLKRPRTGAHHQRK